MDSNYKMRIRSDLGLAAVFATFAAIFGFVSVYLYKGVGSTVPETSLAEKHARMRQYRAALGFGAGAFIGVFAACIGLYQAFKCYRNPANCARR